MYVIQTHYYPDAIQFHFSHYNKYLPDLYVILMRFNEICNINNVSVSSTTDTLSSLDNYIFNVGKGRTMNVLKDC